MKQNSPFFGLKFELIFFFFFFFFESLFGCIGLRCSMQDLLLWRRNSGCGLRALSLHGMWDLSSLTRD